MKVKRKTSELHKRSFQNDAKEVIHQILKKKKWNSQNEGKKKRKFRNAKKGIPKMKRKKKRNFRNAKKEFPK